MSQSRRSGYKRYLQPNSSEDVPRSSKQRFANLRSSTETRPLAEDLAPDFGEASTSHGTSSQNNPPEDSSLHISSSSPDDSGDDDSSSDESSYVSSFDDSVTDHEDSDVASETSESSTDRRNRCRQKVNADYDLDSPPPSHITLTKFEILVLILHFVMRFGLSDVALKALISLVNTILGTTIIPPSMHLFERIFSSNVKKAFHLYCSKCLLYLGSKESCKEVTVCPSCEEPVDHNSLNRNNFFLSISIEDQIRDRLEGPDGESIMTFLETKTFSDETKICDVFDGVVYKDLKNKVGNPPFLTLNLNTDGARVFKSSGRSLWPIQFYLNELPPSDRFAPHNILVAGLWFGKGTISMVTYLSVLVRELQKLAEEGVQWFRAATNRMEFTRVFAINFVVDTVAKAKLCNMIQFNGHNSCFYCLHPGVLLENNQVRYDYRESNVLRTDMTVRNDMREAQNTQTMVNGMKGMSALCFLPHFRFPFSVVLDYMHSHLLGVPKYLCEDIWMNSKFHDKDFYLSNQKQAIINERIKALTPPTNISRDTRPLSMTAIWKANEWRSWLFYYGPMCLYGVLPTRYYNNFCLLSAALFFFNGSQIDRDQIAKYGDYLSLFVKEYEQLYGRDLMTSNVHSTEHIKQVVISCGPLWSYSAFAFESGNGYLIKLVQGSNGVAQQIARRYCTYFSIPKTIDFHPPLNNAVIEYCDLIIAFRRFKVVGKCNEITIPGNKFSKKFEPSNEELAIMEERLQGIDSRDMYFIKKIIFQGSVFTSSDSLSQIIPRTVPKRNDSFAFLSNGKIVKILKFFISSPNFNKLYFIGREVKIEENKRSIPFFNHGNFHIKLCSVSYMFTEGILILPADTISEKCIFYSNINDDDPKYVSPFPNFFEKD